MDYEPQDIEAKWRRRWAETGRYEADPQAPGEAGDGESETTFVTVPYPYPSGGMHIGHARTYTVPDVYARYRRQQGDDVLFPIAWHVTGTPIIGAVERLKKEDPQQIESLQDAFGVPEADLKDLETPMGFARYFIEEADSSYKNGMTALGHSIDWRREFTTNDERYSKFITWQYETLKERGLLEKGLHPVKYCTNEENPVTTHDLLEGEEAEFQEYTLIRFSIEMDGEAAIAPMATLRPETVRGVTNAFVNPDGEYVRATVDGEPWVVSADAVEKLRLQAREVDVEATFSGEALIGETVENPVTGESVTILPATFVDTDNATGVVMSVPAHSPDDYVALRAVQADAETDPDSLTRYGIDPDAVGDIEPVPILTIEGYGEIPAKDAVESAGIDATDDPELHSVTQDLYQAEFHRGELVDSYGEFAGEVVEAVRDRFRDHHQASGAFDAMYEFSEPVVCRCGGDVEVAEQETWFLRYNDPEWKAKAHEAVDGLDAIPENTREQYDHTIDWLNEWPCIRNYGLGTRLPWDDEFVIEPLSDSTIYMAYYTIAHRIEEIPVEDLDRDFFDALFFGPEGVEDPDPRAIELREGEFDHWYPVDYRCSANDLISNHLTFFLFHHAELFEPDEWPQGITVMGMGLLEGEKMSSSKGHVEVAAEVVDEYGADTVRFFLLNSGEPWQDFDWRAEEVSATRDQLARFWRHASEVIQAEVPDVGSTEADAPDERPHLAHVDRWLLGRAQDTVEAVTEALEGFETRYASQTAFYRFEEHLRWYRRRTDTDRPAARWTLREVLSIRLRLLAPFVPFMANELHERLTGEPAEDAPWPEPVAEFQDPALATEEGLVKDVHADVADIVDVTGTDPDVVRIYTAADWKHRVFDEVAETGPDVGAVMGKVMQYDGLRDRGDAVADLVQELVEFVRERPDDEVGLLTQLDEQAVYEGAASFLASEFDADVEVYAEDEDPLDPAEKAEQAVPFRPAIHIE